MDRDTDSVRGWKAYKFRYGKPVDVCYLEVPQEYSNDIYKPEKIDEGCYLTEVDFDRLDSQ